ncbi:MAG TPA: hypothetical protein VFJ30_12380 [Phycisphaerae bacterium]|nr:hypothetical protein [Phycisphaerae bacterium]
MPRLRIHHMAMRSSLAVAAGLLAGCARPIELRPEIPPPTQAGVPLTPLARNVPNEAASHILAVRLRLITLQLPLGASSGSEEIWSYLNEEGVAAGAASPLAYNGVRAGMGRENAWPDVARVLTRLAGRTLQRSQLVTVPGSTVPIVLQQFAEEQTIFIFRADRTLFGRDYPPGDNVLMTATGIDLDNPSSVRLSCTPLVRTTRRRNRYVQTPTGYQLREEPDYLPIPELQLGFTVPAGGFVLIGPGQEAQRETSPGSRFLLRRQRGVPFETILVIAPEVFTAPVRTRP